MKILPLLHLQYQSIMPPMTQLHYSTHCSYKKDISFHENWQGENYLEVLITVINKHKESRQHYWVNTE
jgi:hypothetical protein